MGTVAYMSPEQARARPLDHRTDIFSLGVVLYEMLAGQRPFGGNSQVETMHAIINDPAPPLAQQPPELNEVLEQALAKDPKDRYQHAGDLALDLRRLRNGWQTRPCRAWELRPRLSPFTRGACGVSAVGLAAGWWIGHARPPSGCARMGLIGELYRMEGPARFHQTENASPSFRIRRPAEYLDSPGLGWRSGANHP
jgi:hypothetical protein